MAEKETNDLKNKLSTACSILRWELCDMWGHASVKSPDGKRFLLLHLRPPMDPDISAEDVLEIDLEGNLLSGRRNKPDEIFFHTCAYKTKENVGAVIHCHPPMAVTLAATGRRIIPIYQHVAHFGRGVPVSPWLYGTMLEHGERAVKSMGESCALVIQGHGALVTGETLEEACINMVRLERNARMVLAAAAVGNPTPIPPSAARQFHSIYSGGGSKEKPGQRRKSIGHEMEWHYYESLIKKGERWNRL